MNKKRRIKCSISILLIVGMCMALVSFSLAADRFVDVDSDAWYSKYIYEATDRGLFIGIGNRRFDPEGTMTRAMLVTVLWRIEGEPAGGADGFVDIVPGEYYYEAVKWAKAENIVNGMDAEHFGPDISVTREQMTTILARYANYHGYVVKTSELNGYTDISSVSEYAETSIKWAVSNAFLRCADGMIRPREAATRAEVAACLVGFLNWSGLGEESPSETDIIPEDNDEKNSTTDEKNDEEAENTGTEEGSNQPVFVVSSATARPGDSGIEITVSMKNNPGITAFLLDVKFDDENLHFESIEYNLEIGGTAVTSQNKQIPLCIFWVEGLSDLHGDWVIATLKFNVDQAAVNGDYDITLSYDADNVFNLLEENIAFEIMNGKICVRSQ